MLRGGMGRGIFVCAVCAGVAVAACGGRVIQQVGNADATGGAAGYAASTSFGGLAGSACGTSFGGSPGNAGTTSFGGFGNAGAGTGFGGFGPGGAMGIGGFFSSTGGFASTPDGGFCIATTYESFTELELLFVVDQSLPLGCALPNMDGTPWLGMTGGIEDFAKAPSRPDIDVGLALFGRPMADAGAGATSSCFVNDYRTFDVAPAVVAANLGSIVNTLETHRPLTDGTLSAAYAGAMLTLEAGLPDPGKKYAVVLVTGTEPDVCSMSASSPASTAGDGLNSGIETFVISTAAPSSACVPNSPPRSIDLNEIAAQGGSGKAIVLDPSAPLRAQMVTAIDTVVEMAEPVCSYKVGATLAPESAQAIEVDYTDSSGSHVVDQVTKGACDPSTGGWYFDDPKDPTTIDLCTPSCYAVGVGNGMTIRFACGGAVGALAP